MKFLPYDLTREELIRFTPKWNGERYEDGRPRVSDKTLDTIEKYVTITHAWAICQNAGYPFQVLHGFQSTRPGELMVGRALTALYLPQRPDFKEVIMTGGHESGEIGDCISWPIDRLTERDVYVADVYGKILDGPVIGERLANAIYARSHNGVVHNCAVRDIEGIEAIEGFHCVHRGVEPSYASPTIVLGGINCPMRMETVTVMPGDVVLAKDDLVCFVPPHLADWCALSGAIIAYRDQFSVERMRTKTYTSGQIDAQWTEEIEADFDHWLSQQKNVPFTQEELEYSKRERLW